MAELAHGAGKFSSIEINPELAGSAAQRRKREKRLLLLAQEFRSVGVPFPSPDAHLLNMADAPFETWIRQQQRRLEAEKEKKEIARLREGLGRKGESRQAAPVSGMQTAWERRWRG